MDLREEEKKRESRRIKGKLSRRGRKLKRSIKTPRGARTRGSGEQRKAGPGKERAILVVRLATGEIDLVALGCWPNPHANAGKEAGINFSS
jgi:hypothetical protein